jgi:hypothetical protein
MGYLTAKLSGKAETTNSGTFYCGCILSLPFYPDRRAGNHEIDLGGMLCAAPHFIDQNIYIWALSLRG